MQFTFKPVARATMLVAGAFIAATAVQAQTAAPEFTWYGTLNLAAENMDDGSFVRNGVQSISSKLGIKGERAINKDLKAMFQLETGVAQDDSANSKALANRNSFVGLKADSWGQVLLGTYDMPLKDLKGFNADMQGNDDVVEVVANGKGLKASASSKLFTQNVHTRQNNVVNYASPKFQNMQVKVAYGMNEPVDNTVVKTPVYGASLEYNDGTFSAGLAFETKESANCTVAACTTTTVNGNTNARKAIIGYKASDALSFSAVLASLDNGLSGTFATQTNPVVVSGTYKSGDYTYRLAYGNSPESNSGRADAFSMYALEVMYSLDKNTAVYGYYTAITNDTAGKAKFEAGENTYGTTAGNDPRALGFGIQYKF